MKRYLLLLSFIIGVLISFAQTTLDTALNFTIKDTYGNNWELFEILEEGQIVVIDFFSTA